MNANNDEIQLIIFKLGEEAFGVNIFEVKEIIKREEITKIPEVDTYVEGMINLRGEVISLIDLAKRLSLKGNAENKDTRNIIVETDNNLIGMRVDEVLNVTKFSKEKIRSPSKLLLEKIHDEYIEGVVLLDDLPVVILDLAKILDKKEINTIEKKSKETKKKEDKKEVAENPKKNTSKQKKKKL